MGNLCGSVDFERRHISDIVYHKYKWHSHITSLAVMKKIKVCLVLAKISFRKRHVFWLTPLQTDSEAIRDWLNSIKETGETGSVLKTKSLGKPRTSSSLQNPLARS